MNRMFALMGTVALIATERNRPQNWAATAFALKDFLKKTDTDNRRPQTVVGRVQACEVV